MRDEFVRRRPALSGAVVVVVILIIIIATGAYLYLPQVRQSVQKIETSQAQFGGASSSFNSTTSTSSTPLSSSTSIEPVPVVSIYGAYVLNQAAGDSEYGGKVLYIQGVSSTVEKDGSGNYVSICPLGSSSSCVSPVSCLLSTCGTVLYVWQNQGAASQVPLPGTNIVVRCAVSGIQYITNSSGTVDGFQVFATSVLVLNNCAVVNIITTTSSVSATTNIIQTSSSTTQTAKTSTTQVLSSTSTTSSSVTSRSVNTTGLFAQVSVSSAVLYATGMGPGNTGKAFQCDISSASGGQYASILNTGPVVANITGIDIYVGSHAYYYGASDNGCLVGTIGFRNSNYYSSLLRPLILPS